MSPIVRAWLAFAAVAAGILHLAGAVDSNVAVPLALLGIAEFGWGLFVMAAARLVAPRATIGGAFAAVAASVALVFVPGGPSALSLLVSAFLALAIAVIVAAHLRSPREQREVTAGRYALGLVAGGIVVAAIALPALVSTSLGSDAPVGNFVDEHGHRVP